MASGKLLLVLKRKLGDTMGPLQKKMEEVLIEEAKVICRTNELEL